MIIATYLNDVDQVADFFESGQICLFEKAADSWTKCEAIPLSLHQQMSLAQMRAALMASASNIQECETFLVKDLRGILRVFLEELGFKVWKSEGTLLNQLESVALKEQEMLDQEEPQPIPSPQPVNDEQDGLYRIDLVQLLRSGIPHVSAEVLLPFLETVAFRRLEVVCEHVPRWFDTELPTRGLRVESQVSDESGQQVIVTVVPQCGLLSCPSGRRSGSFRCHCGG